VLEFSPSGAASRRAMKRFRAPNMVVKGCDVEGGGEGDFVVWRSSSSSRIGLGEVEDRC
jgi:hypothetical protein